MVTKIKPHGIDATQDFIFDDITANTVILKGISANGTAGSNGNVLMSNGAGVYWSTIVGGYGDKGDKGDKGIDGIIGSNGAKGDKGDKGVDGTIGVNGAKGDKGDTGATGVKGSIGDKGQKGDVEQQGNKGDKGDKGQDGYQGFDGQKGEPGTPGVLDLTLDTFIGNGTNTQFTLSKTPISENYTVVVINGVVQLKSDYSISGNTLIFTDAVSNGAPIEVQTFEGGAKGDKGDVGPKGEVGAKGLDGTLGADGAKGEKGEPNGPKGDKGDIGPKGDVGIPGFQGLQGDKGNKGDVGDKGNKGDISSINLAVDTFTGNGSNTQFTLSATPVNKNYTVAVLNGVTQLRSEYTVVGNIITFNGAIPNGAPLEVTSYIGGSKGDKGEKGTDGVIGNDGAPGAKGDKGDPNGPKGDKGDPSTVKGDKGDKGSQGDSIKGDKGSLGDKGQKGDASSIELVLDSFVGNGSNTQFTLTAAPDNENYTLVIVNGVTQSKTDYSIVGNVITFNEPIASGAPFEITTFTGGSKGEKGAPGNVEAQGNKGEKGDTGEKGIPGTYAGKGDKGDKGELGTKGDQGFGDKGAKGEPGTAAAKGDKGDTGAAGADGPANLFDVTINSFTGNGSNTQFTLSSTPLDKNHTIVTVYGVVQHKITYSLSGSNIIFTQAPPNNSSVEVLVMQGGAKGEPGNYAGKGDKGDIGPKGDVGPLGNKGDIGDKGSKGEPSTVKGDKGDLGSKGDVGVTGAKGQKGDLGTTGVKGQKGDEGTKYLTITRTGNITTPYADNVRYYPPQNMSVSSVSASVSTAPSSAFTFRINKNGANVGVYTISSGQYSLSATAASFTANTTDYLTVSFLSGSTTDAHIQLKYNFV
jgi:integrin beta 8/collagen type VII alpha